MSTRQIACCSRFRRLFLAENGSLIDDSAPQTGLDPQDTFEAVYAGMYRSAAVATDGHLWVWGNVDQGFVASFTSTAHTVYTAPMRVPRAMLGNGRVQKVALGDFHSCVVADGRLYTCGYGADGRLGRGHMGFEACWIPNLLAQVVLAGVHVSDVAAGPSSSAAVDSTGRVFAWGANRVGEAGVGDMDRHWSPTLVPGFGDEVKAASVSMHLHVAVVDSAGGLHTAGRNTSGQLGLGDREPRLLLARVQCGPVRMAVCGMWHTLVLDTLGKVLVCGSNEAGTLGIGAAGDATDSVSVLQPVEGLSDVVFVTAGIRISMAVNAEGIVFEWGSRRARASEAVWWPGSTDIDIEYTTVPTPQVVDIPARVGRYGLPLLPLQALSLAMGTHTRLGGSSPLCALPVEVLRRIAEREPR